MARLFCAARNRSTSTSPVATHLVIAIARMKPTFFVIVLVNFLYFTLTLFGHITVLEDWHISTVGRTCNLALFAVALVGMIYFIVDAFRRKYEGSRPWAIALVLLGPFSFGLCTLIYCAAFGWRAREFEYRDHFCDACLRASSEYQSPLDLTTLNQVNGGRFVGRSERCPDCGSTIRTHCFYLFGIPLYSSGSFRVQCVAMDHYLARKCDFYWPHLAKIAVLPAICVPLIVLAAYYTVRQK
jgi:hypothetical protein